MLSTLHWCLAGETKLKNLHKLGMPAGGWPYPCCCNAIRFNSTNIYWVSRCAEHCAKGWGAGKAAQPTTTALEDVPTTIDVQPRETAWASVQTVFTSLSAFTSYELGNTTMSMKRLFWGETEHCHTLGSFPILEISLPTWNRIGPCILF